MTDLYFRKKSVTENLSNSSGSSPEEEGRLKSLFMSCDSNNDGRLDRTDLISMCKKLNMTELAEEIICALGANTIGSTISFSEFLRCRADVLRGVEGGQVDAEYVHYYSQTKYDHVRSSCSDMSQIYSSVDYDSGTHETQEEALSIFAMLQQCYPDLFNQWTSLCQLDTHSSAMFQEILHCANHIHLARINRLYVELKIALKRINTATINREMCQKEMSRTEKERDKLKLELQNQLSRYEDRLTELHSVIAELQKKNERNDRSTILEEEEEESNNVEEYERLDINKLSDLNHGMQRSSTASLLDNNTCSMDRSIITEAVHNSYVGTDIQRVDTIIFETGDTENIQSDRANDDVALIEEQALISPHHNDIYVQEKLSGYECVVTNLRIQLNSVIEEREFLRKQLKDIQECTELGNMPNQHCPQYSSSSSVSKLSVDSKSTTSSCSSPARPIMGVRQQSKQIHMRSQTPEPEWVTKTVSRYQRSIQSNGNNNNTLQEMIANCLNEDSNFIQTSGLLFLQEMADLIPYASMVEPCKRICLEWQRLVAMTDRESSDKLLLESTLAETKSIADQLQCCVMQLQSDCAVLSKSNTIADQIIELADIMIQLQETDPVSSFLDVSYQQKLLEPAYQNSSAIFGNRKDVSQLRYGYREQLESAAKMFLCRLECYGSLGRQTPDSGAGVSSTLSSGGGSVDVEGVLRQTSGDWSKTEEVKLRRLLDQLIADRNRTRLSIAGAHLGQSVYGQCLGSSNQSSPRRPEMDNLSSVNLDPSLSSNHQQLIESAILIQEVCTLKEERASLKTSIYMLEKEIKALQLGLDSRIASEKSLKVQLTHMVQHRSESTSSPLCEESRQLKSQINDLLQVLDELRERYQVQQQQNEEFVNDLKRANAALIGAFDRAKKKYQSKITRLEQQLSIVPRSLIGSLPDETAL